MSESYVSPDLYHFVGSSSPTDHERNYETLRKVIHDRTVSHSPHVAGTWGATQRTFDWSADLPEGGLIVPTVTCYCDIPFDHLGVHMAKYGQFGLSFDRNLLVKYGARPVTYVPMCQSDWGSPFGRQLLRNIERVYRSFHDQAVEHLAPATGGHSFTTALDWNSACHAIDSVFGKDFLAFLKPFWSELLLNDATNYYLEREWRKFGNLVFEPNDVHSVVVAPDFVERASSEFPILRGKLRAAPAVIG